MQLAIEHDNVQSLGSVLCIATDDGHCRVAETFGLKKFLDAGAGV